MSSNIKLCDTTQLKPGDWLSRISYMKVVEIRSNGTLKVENENGYSWSIAPDVVEQECRAAGQFKETRKVTRTQLAEKLKSAGHLIFTVEFEKQPTTSSVEKHLTDSDIGDLTVVKKRRKLARDILKGPVRTLVGHLKQSEPHMGRSVVCDLEIPTAQNERQVDHRKINYIIIDNVRYQQK